MEGRVLKPEVYCSDEAIKHWAWYDDTLPGSWKGLIVTYEE